MAYTSLKGARILIVDDNYINRRIARNFVSQWDVEMDEAVNGKEALQLHSEKAYNLLLLDLDMPGMNGHETIYALRKIDQNIFTVAFTDLGAPGLKEQLISEGFSDVLSKPFKPEDLHRQISNSIKPASE